MVNQMNSFFDSSVNKGGQNKPTAMPLMNINSNSINLDNKSLMNNGQPSSNNPMQCNSFDQSNSFYNYNKNNNIRDKNLQSPLKTDQLFFNNSPDIGEIDMQIPTPINYLNYDANNEAAANGNELNLSQIHNNSNEQKVNNWFEYQVISPPLGNT